MGALSSKATIASTSSTEEDLMLLFSLRQRALDSRNFTQAVDPPDAVLHAP